MELTIKENDSKKIIIKKLLGIYCIFQFIIRILLMHFSRHDISHSIFDGIKTFLLGFIYDIPVGLYFILPIFLFMIFSGAKLNRPIFKIILRIMVFVFFINLVFLAFAEYLFWDEFQTKFNFITVDYIVYTTELIGNIWQSYNMPLIICAIVVLALVLSLFLHKDIKGNFLPSKITIKLIKIILYVLVLVLSYFVLDSSYREKLNKNIYNIEISGNGPYEFFHAFFNNSLKYDQFYKTYDNKQMISDLRAKLKTSNTKFTDEGTITREIDNSNVSDKIIDKKPNVVLIVVESLSSRYSKFFGNRDDYTPLLDKIAENSLTFTNCYATGTRTVRGLEAITLSIPPTPGQSIVRRPDNNNLFNVGSVFRKENYSTEFIYGGYGAFDNMNAFYEDNGFTILDRTNIPKEEIIQETIWGVADEVLFDQAEKSLDKHYNETKPVFQLIMTTTNHRPFTFPENRIDPKIGPQKSRRGAIRYTDWAINDFIEKSKNKPWFDNTIFIIIADHNANAAGKVELPVNRYKIPVVVYAPKLINAQKNNRLMSQIDFFPTLFGIMGVSYESKFLGYDINQIDPSEERIFISTYQQVGYINKDKLVILSPKKIIKTYKINNYETSDYTLIDNDERSSTEAMTWYQGASFFFENSLLKEKDSSK